MQKYGKTTLVIAVGNCLILRIVDLKVERLRIKVNCF